MLHAHVMCKCLINTILITHTHHCMSQQSQWPAGTADPWPATHPAGPSPSSARCHRSGQRAGTPALWTLEKNTITWTTRTSQLEQARAATALHSPNNRSFPLPLLSEAAPPPPPPPTLLHVCVCVVPSPVHLNEIKRKQVYDTPATFKHQLPHIPDSLK